MDQQEHRCGSWFGRFGVKYVAEPGGSVRDDNVIAAADSHDMVMCFTGLRLFHH